MSEQQEYETVWSGATWREAPAPEFPAASTVTYRKEAPTVSMKTRIQLALDGEWRRIVEIADRAGLGSNGVVCMTVKRLVDEGFAERMPSPQATRGRKGFLYRKAQGAA